MKNLLMVSFLLLWVVEGRSQHLTNPFTSLTDEDRSWEMWRRTIDEQLEESGSAFDLTSLLHNVFTALKSSSFPTAVASNISQQCLQDSQLYVHSLYTNRSLWALQMKESSGQLPPGLFGSFNFQADGLFDECQAVKAPDFDGQYCKVFFKTAPVNQSEIVPQKSTGEEQSERSNFITIFQLLGRFLGTDRVDPKLSAADAYSHLLPSVSFCLPSSCSAEDLGQAVAELIGSYVIANKSIVTITDEQYCFKESNNPPALDGATITVIVVLSLIGFLVVSATIHEAWRMYRGTDFDTKKDVPTSSNDNFGCIHGLRFFSTCWVVMGHTWNFMISKILNPKAAYKDALGIGMQTIGNATVSVDTFFLMSGLLVSFLLLRELDRNKGKFNVGLFYLHRYLRLTPVYAVILGFVATLMVYLGTGPNWYSVTFYADACRTAWWRQFLYINNAKTQCMGQSWYLAIDMQLFILSPLFIYPLWRWKKFGLAWLAFVTLLCHAAIFAVYAIYDLPPTVIITRSNKDNAVSEYYVHYYLKTWARAPPYLLGIGVGWYLHITKQSGNRLSKSLVAIGWTLSAIVALAIVYGLFPYVDQFKVPEISSAVKMTYGPLHRTAWACVIAWIILACSRGYGGFVNRILSWKGFLPLGRLTYCVYLIHYDYLNVFYAAVRKQFYYTMFEQFTTCFGVLVVTFALAFVASVTVEASFLNLEKFIFAFKLKGKSKNEIEPKIDEKT